MSVISSVPQTIITFFLFAESYGPIEKFYVNGEDIGDDEYFVLMEGESATITCTALSDPKSEVNLLTSVPANITQHACHRLEGEAPQPWNCSVSATIVNQGDRLFAQCEIINSTGDMVPSKTRYLQSKCCLFMHNFIYY